MSEDFGIDLTYGGGKCPVAGCGKAIPEGHLMCRRHWFSVPHELRVNVSATLGRWLRNQITLGELRHAQDAAIAAAKK